MSVVSFHGVPSLVDGTEDEEATERNVFRTEEEYLPDDLLVDILSRVPWASLARFRSVSKRWKALINYVRFKKSSQIMLIDSRVYLVSIDFLGAHGNIVNITSQFSLKDPLSNCSEEVNIREVFHCEGLLLCTTEDNRLVVGNPCLDETTWIKPTSYYGRSDIFAFGKSSRNNMYKILRIALHGPGPDFEFMKPCLYEIYDFTSNSWRVVHDETRDWSILGLGRRGTCVDGKAYWLACSSGQHLWMDVLLRFDFTTERFTSMCVPSPGRTFALSVTRQEQKLCMLASVASDVDVWMANKIDGSGAMSWSKFLTVKRVYNNNQWMFLTGMNFLVDEENKVIVCPGKALDSGRFLHIVGEDKCMQVDRHEAGSRCSLLLSYAPTLVSASDVL